MKELLEGKVKTVFETDEEDKVLIRYEDRVTAFNGEHIEYPRDKGATCCMISAFLFERLERVGIKTHYIDVPTLNTMLCRKVKIVPVEIICRNRAAGSIIEHTEGLYEGQLFDPPIIEFFLKDDYKGDPLLTLDRVRLMGIDPEPFILRTTEINWELQKIFEKIGMDLIDFKLEFGRDERGGLYLADEISPDSMRLWKKGSKERFDKDLFRKDEGDIVEAYKYILQQLKQFS
jgi:phosphoribosylaminoimidazole-succinocarboxamide synthase